MNVSSNPIRIFLSIVFLLVLSNLTSSAASYYVSSSDPNADDSYTTPTSALPWKTLAKVNATTFLPGDTIYLKCGDTWRETLSIASSGNSGGRITFTSYGTGAKPVISGADLVTGWTTYSGGTANTYQAVLSGTAKMVTSDSTYLKKGGSVTTLAANQYYWSAGVLYINIGADPTTHAIEAGQRSNPVYANVARNYITLLGLRIEKSNLANVYVYNSTFWTVQNCDLFFGNSNGTFAGAGLHAGKTNDLLFTGNHVNYALGDGVMVWIGLRVEVSNNVIENVLDDGGNPGADGIQIGALSTTPNACDNFKILNNTVTRPSTSVEKGCIIAEMGDNGVISGNVCTAGKFSIALSSNNGVMSYNYVTGFGTYGGLRVTQDQALSGVQIYYNVLTNAPLYDGIVIADDTGGSVHRSNFKICNNVIYNTFTGINIAVPFSGTINNNIVWNDVTADPQIRLSVASIIAGETFASDYNIWQKKGTAKQYMRLNGILYWTFAAWQATGYDAHSTTANPLWVNPSNSDFHLSASSPAIDTGADLGLTEDLDGNAVPQGTASDMGAYEYATPLAFTVPSSLTAEAANSSGAVVAFTTSAVDTDGASQPTTNTPASGSTFPIGTTIVNAAAINSLGYRSSKTFTVTVTLPAPSALTAVAQSESQIHLTWVNNSANATSCVVQRSLQGANIWSVLTTTLSPGSGSYTDATANASTNYDYRIQCVWPGGASSGYALVSAATPAGIGDGIAGSWRLQYFGDGLSNAGSSAATADPDGDGMTNLQEYIAGTNPIDPNSTLCIASIVKSGSDMAVSFSTASGKFYRLDKTTSLAPGSWVTVLDGIAGSGGMVSVIDPWAAAQSRGFYHLTAHSLNTNVAQGQATATDSVNGTYVGANAVDGNITSDTSRWLSANTAYPHWIEVDFPTPRTINEIRFYTGYQTYSFPIAAYTLQRWDSGTSSWVAIVSRTGNANASVDELFTAVSTAKVRLYATQGSIDNYLRLYEIVVMGY